MEKSFCFNSINGDRKYKAEDFREYFATFIGNGVFPNPSTNLQVIGENGDMTVTLKVGNGWINGALYINDNDLILPIDVADGVLNRIDRIVLRMDTVGRAINAKVKKGAFASSPVAPVLQRDADGYEIGIADIYIAAGATQITQANITDLRLNTSLCGIVHGTVEQVDTTTLFNQYLSWLTQKKAQYDADMLSWTAQKQTDFNTWYNNITSASQTEIDNMEADFQQDWDSWFSAVQNVLDGDTAGNLLNMINNLAGEGRTTETVKGNADDIASLEEEYNAHDMRAATGNILGHVKVDNDSVKIDSNGVISVRKPLDYGRYQAEFGLEDAVLSGCDINNNIVKLGYSELSVVKQEHEDASTYVWNSYYVSQTIVSNGIDFDAVEYVELLVNKLNSPPGTLKVDLYDEMSKTTLATATVKDITSSESWCRATFESPVKITKGHDLVIRVYDGVSNSSTNSYRVYYSTTDVFENGFSNYSENGFTSNGALGKDLAFRLGVYHNATTGTATKTYAPTDIDKWGNVKVTVANINANNSATVTVKSSADVQLKSPVTLVNGDNYIDISSINSSTYPSLKVVITLNRNSVSDASPTINVSVTWEGNGKKSAYGEFQNLNMISISPNNDFTFTIPLGIFAKHGRASLCSNVTGSSGAQVMFTTDSSQSQSQVTGSGVSSSGSAYRGNDALTTTGQFGGNIKLKSMYISSMNLIVTFNNISTSVTSSLGNVYILWEVFI